MNHDEIEKYHKYNKFTMSYGEAEKYIALGWKIASIKHITLQGINKEYDECHLIWDNDSEPIVPND